MICGQIKCPNGVRMGHYKFQIWPGYYTIYLVNYVTITLHLIWRLTFDIWGVSKSDTHTQNDECEHEWNGIEWKFYPLLLLDI